MVLAETFILLVFMKELFARFYLVVNSVCPSEKAGLTCSRLAPGEKAGREHIRDEPRLQLLVRSYEQRLRRFNGWRLLVDELVDGREVWIWL